MSNAPHEYASWLPLLDRFRDGDDSVVELMRHGSIEWSDVVAQRWTLHVSSALEARLKLVSKQLQLNLNRANGDAFAIARSLIDARRALQTLWLFVSIPCLQENLKNHLKNELERWTKQTQDTLEKNAKEIRIDNGRLLKIIRDNSLVRPLENEVPGPSTTIEPQPLRRGRRVIL